MLKPLHYLLLIIAILFNPVMAAESGMDIWQHKTMPVCHSIDCGAAEPAPCGEECAQPVSGCCNPVVSAVIISKEIILKRAALQSPERYRNNYISVISPPLYHPPRQII